MATVSPAGDPTFRLVRPPCALCSTFIPVLSPVFFSAYFFCTGRGGDGRRPRPRWPAPARERNRGGEGGGWATPAEKECGGPCCQCCRHDHTPGTDRRCGAGSRQSLCVFSLFTPPRGASHPSPPRLCRLRGSRRPPAGSTSSSRPTRAELPSLPGTQHLSRAPPRPPPPTDERHRPAGGADAPHLCCHCNQRVASQPPLSPPPGSDCRCRPWGCRKKKKESVTCVWEPSAGKHGSDNGGSETPRRWARRRRRGVATAALATAIRAPTAPVPPRHRGRGAADDAADERALRRGASRRRR